MNELEIKEQGLLIPTDCLTGLSGRFRVRRIRNGLLVEAAEQAASRDELIALVDRLRAAAADEPLDQTDIDALVEEVRDERAGNR